ncbi:MAG TPA: phage major capsid protein [Thermoguttaceae bacterium]|nr:phage major capsid protein [Thermoguttaceae bacterium]
MTVDQINEKIAELHAKATALNNLAKKEKRDLTDEESAEFDGYMAECKRLKEVEIPRAKWLEDEAKRLSESTRQTQLQPTGLDDGQFPAPRIVVPRAARFYENRLRAFHGEGAVEAAYTAAQFYAATLWQSRKARAWCEKHNIQAALSTDSDEKGGAVVPLEIEKRIIDLAEEYGTARRKCERVPMGSDTKIWPRVTGGLTVYFPGENGSITESEPTFDNITLVARKAATLTRVSSELEEDSMIAIGDLITRKIALAFATKEDQCCFLGTGAGATYCGISGLITECAAATATVVTAITANTAFSTLDLADFESMLGKLPMYPGINPEWYISKAGWAASMMRLADAAGGNTAAIIEGQRREMFLGYPVNLVQCMNTTLTAQTSAAGICYFGDLGMAASFGDRRGMTVAVSDQRYFEYDQIGIRGTERFDINVHDVGNTSVAGAMVMLSMPSS